MVSKLKSIGDILILIPLIALCGVYLIVAIGSLFIIIGAMLFIVNIIPAGVMVAYYFTDDEITKTVLLFISMVLVALCTSIAVWYTLREKTYDIEIDLDENVYTKMENNVNNNNEVG